MNSFGRKFKVSIFGESHGVNIGATIDGTPPGIPLCENDFANDLDRRKPNAKGTTSRKETDTPTIVSGVFNGYTTGAPITILFQNNNTISNDYKNLAQHPRPSHADFVAGVKYKGFNDPRGGGHFSGRITLTLVAAGVIAKKILDQFGVNIEAQIVSIAGVDIDNTNPKTEQIIEHKIEQALANCDSLGGVVKCTAKGVKVGIGEPFFDSVESRISHIIFAIPAVKAIEFGEGFNIANMNGSDANDTIINAKGTTKTNHNGGVVGGIANGNDITFKVAIKPTPSIAKPQPTFNLESQKIENLEIKGRHDACITLRTPVIIEAAAAIAIADLYSI